VDRRERDRLGKSIPTRFAEAPDTDGVPKRGQTVTSRNRLRIGPLADLVDLEGDYRFCALIDARAAAGVELRKLADDSVAKKAVAALKRAEGRADLPQIYDEKRKQVLSTWRADANMALTAVDRAIASGSTTEAVLIARSALLDYSGCGLDAALKERIGKLQSKEVSSATDKPFAARNEFAKAIGAALAADRAARRTDRAGDRVNWKAVENLYRAALAKGAGRDGLQPLEKRIDWLAKRSR
jgi:hypothetical protein